MLRRCLRRDDKGVAAIEMAFALPILIVMIWIFVQLAQVYRAVAGIQQALGEGARYATLCLSPTSSGCSTPTTDQVKKDQPLAFGKPEQRPQRHERARQAVPA